MRVLHAVATREPKTLSFAWTLALHRGDIAEAQRLAAEAKKTAMKPEGIQTMEQATLAEARLLAGWRATGSLCWAARSRRWASGLA